MKCRYRGHKQYKIIVSIIEQLEKMLIRYLKDPKLLPTRQFQHMSWNDMLIIEISSFKNPFRSFLVFFSATLLGLDYTKDKTSR